MKIHYADNTVETAWGQIDWLLTADRTGNNTCFACVCLSEYSL